MKIAYIIDRESSYLKVTLEVIKELGKGSFPFSKDLLTKKNLFILGEGKDRELLSFLFSFPSLCLPHVTLPLEKSFEVIKQASATGRLFFKDRRLLCDLLGKTEFFYSLIPLENDCCKIEGRLKWGKQDIALSECDFFCLASPSWFVKGTILKVLSEEIHQRWVKRVYPSGSFFLNREEKTRFLETFSLGRPPRGPSLSIPDGFIEETQKDPSLDFLPSLVLKDPYGIFADFWVLHSEGKKQPFHEMGMQERQWAKSWEDDLLETDFIKKKVENTHYYCPSDKVLESLSFLVELGWIIVNLEGKRVECYTDIECFMEVKAGRVIAKGKVSYGESKVKISSVADALSRKENFVQLGEGKVGLMPKDWQGSALASLVDGEFVEGDVCLRSRDLCKIPSLLEEDGRLFLDSPLERLRAYLGEGKSLEKSLPGENFKGVLRSYQQEGLNWLVFLQANGFNGLLADDMGLGKTVQVIAFLSKFQVNKPILLVVPKTLLFHWESEIKKFLPKYRIYHHRGKKRFKDPELLKNQEIVIASYGILREDESFFHSLSFSMLILDEAQAIKNPQTRIAKIIYRLQADFKLSLTGTPIENHLTDLWSQFHFLMPDLLGSQEEFKVEILSTQVDPKNLSHIRKKVSPFLLRRRKNDVAKDLPEKTEQVVFVEMLESQRNIYDSFLSNVRKGLLQKVSCDGMAKHRLEVFEAILRLRQICCHPLLLQHSLDEDQLRESAKLQSLLLDLQTVVNERHKVLIYSQFTSMLNLIAGRIEKEGWKYVRLDGKTVEREATVKQFQEDAEVSIFLLSLKAGGVGLNLTAADYVFLYEPWWNEAAENQAIDRAHRIGRSRPIIAKRYIVAESIEEKMMELKRSKSTMIDGIVGKNDAMEGLSLEDFSYLLSS